MNTNEQAVIDLNRRIESLKQRYMEEARRFGGLVKEFESIDQQKDGLTALQIHAVAYFNAVEDFISESDLLGASRQPDWANDVAETCYSVLETVVRHYTLIDSFCKKHDPAFRSYFAPNQIAYSKMQRLVASQLPGNLISELRQKLIDVGLSTYGFDHANKEVDSMTEKTQTVGGRKLAAQEYRHVIALVHGIHDIGAWQATVSAELASEGTHVAQIRYGHYPAARFLFPLNLSGAPVRKVVEGLRNLKEEFPNAHISVIGHSFGTYVVQQVLRYDHNLKLWKVLFCGSVADDLTDWAEFKHRIGDGERPTKDFILNDCGTGDKWPVLGTAFGWYYGMAGVTGFSETHVTNRFHRGKNGGPGGHSLYFENEFVRTKWRPFLIDDAAPIPGDGKQGEHLRWYIRILYSPIAQWVARVIALAVWIALFVAAVYLATQLVNRARQWLSNPGPGQKPVVITCVDCDPPRPPVDGPPELAPPAFPKPTEPPPDDNIPQGNEDKFMTATIINNSNHNIVLYRWRKDYYDEPVVRWGWTDTIRADGGQFTDRFIYGGWHYIIISRVDGNPEDRHLGWCNLGWSGTSTIRVPPKFFEEDSGIVKIESQ